MQSRSTLIFLVSVLALTSTAHAQQNRRHVHQPDFFPFSVWYSGGKARAPMLSELTLESRDEWKRDLTNIKKLGFNTVRTWVEWSSVEPRRGQYQLDNLKLLLELANEVGLRVFIQVYVDSAPDWVGQAYPNALFVAQDGRNRDASGDKAPQNFKLVPLGDILRAVEPR